MLALQSSFQPIRGFFLSTLLVLTVLGANRYDGLARQVTTPSASPGTPTGSPAPIVFPADDGPHAEFIEWWYYTGHLFTESGDRYGFEFVVFKGERDGAVLGYASHFAITDVSRDSFHYDQQLAIADGLPTPPPTADGFDLRVNDWRMWGANGDDRLIASMTAEPGYAIALALTPEKPAALHDGDGYVDYGNGDYSYYYSRTRLAVEGTLQVGSEQFAVTGDAWMDHQWGNFNTFSGVGWDWYALNLSDGRDVMLYVIAGSNSQPAIIDGSIVGQDGELTVLEAEDFTVTPTATWVSAETGIEYPSGWSIAIPDEEIELTVTPTMPDQELDTTTTTGVIYWEGEVEVSGTSAGTSVTGLGYVELTGYDKRPAVSRP